MTAAAGPGGGGLDGHQRAGQRQSEDTMFRRPKEYSLQELLEHPVLSVQMANEGIERRCLDLMLDAVSEHRRFAEAEYGERWVGSPSS
jgi:hypothetical protein